MRWIVVDDASARWPSRHRCSENYVFFRERQSLRQTPFPVAVPKKDRYLMSQLSDEALGKLARDLAERVQTDAPDFR